MIGSDQVRARAIEARDHLAVAVDHLDEAQNHPGHPIAKWRLTLAAVHALVSIAKGVQALVAALPEGDPLAGVAPAVRRAGKEDA